MKKVLIVITLCIVIVACSGTNQRTYYTKDTICNYKALWDSLKLDSTCIPIPYSSKEIKAIFYIASGKEDTFHYAISKEDSIYLWAIVRGKSVHLVEDLK